MHGITGNFLVFASIALCAMPSHAQGWPPFSQHVADCEGKWVLHETNQSNDLRALGYVYTDPTAGVTIELHGEVQLNANGELARMPNPLEGKARVIFRVEGNDPVTCLTNEQRDQLGLPSVWEFEDNYKDDRPAGVHYTSWASHYNHIGAFERAMDFVKLARAESFASPKLELEHGFALNAMEQCEAAIDILGAAQRRYPTDVEITAELAYANLCLRRYREAIDMYRKALDDDKNDKSTRRWEFANNISNAFGNLGDEKNATKWRAQAKAWRTKEK